MTGVLSPDTDPDLGGWSEETDAPAAPGGATPEMDDGGMDWGGDEPWWSRRLRALAQPPTLITLVVVVACTVFVFVQMQPSQLFKETTPAGGDMGAHVWLPAYIKRVLLPHFQIFGWTMDWYAGFPALTYYFPLPMVSIAVISYVIPYDIAFKLVSVAGIVTLPVCCYAFGRLARMRFPGPPCLAIASVAYLFGREFTIYGGNIASTMAGEFSFSISLSFGVLFLGVVARGLDTGRNRALAAVLLACCGMSHILPLFFALGGALVLTLMRSRRRAWLWTVPVLVVGGLLISFWALPFELRLPYATNMGYGKITTYLDSLFPHGDTWLFILAGVGGIVSLSRRNRIGTFLLLMSVLAAFVFRFAPNARLWNARVLPFWFLCLYLLVGVAFCELGTMAVERLSGQERVLDRRLVAVPVVTILVALVWVGFPLRILPGGHVIASSQKYDWLGFTSSDNSYVPDWINWNYSGYQSPGKSSRTTYFALINEMKTLGATTGDGCGRAMYEYEPAINDMGTPDALMLLPYWTNGCIASMEGLYYESSATTPYHFLNVSECSEQPSDPMTGLDYASSPDVDECVQHLQMFGVKYFMAVSPQVQQQAAADPSLRYLAKVGPYETDVTNSSNQNVLQKQTWKIYKVLDSSLVTPLANQPVVMNGVSGGGATWLKASEAWYLDPSRWDVYETASGPSTWAHVSSTDTNPPVTPEPATSVTDIKQGEESISFDVDRTGTPILVKTSYYPNWHVSGAKDIYWATPDLMVVVPTSHHVSFSYGYTPVDWTGFILSIFGVGGAVLLFVRRRQSRAAQDPTYEPVPVVRTGGGGHFAAASAAGAVLSAPSWAGRSAGAAGWSGDGTAPPSPGPDGDTPEHATAPRSDGSPGDGRGDGPVDEVRPTEPASAERSVGDTWSPDPQDAQDAQDAGPSPDTGGAVATDPADGGDGPGHD